MQFIFHYSSDRPTVLQEVVKSQSLNARRIFYESESPSPFFFLFEVKTRVLFVSLSIVDYLVDFR